MKRDDTQAQYELQRDISFIYDYFVPTSDVLIHKHPNTYSQKYRKHRFPSKSKQKSQKNKRGIYKSTQTRSNNFRS